MFDVGGGELILIILAVILLFGPKKIPEVMKMVNKGMQQVRKAQTEIQSQINNLQDEIKSNIESPNPHSDKSSKKENQS
jgi:sec-independent protein translocase protein TatA